MAISTGVEGTFRLGDVFSKSFRVFGRNVVAFFLLAALANIPAFVLGLAMGFLEPSLSTAPDATAVVSAVLIVLLTVLVWIVCWMIANGAMTYGVVQDLREGTVSIGQAIAIAARRFWPMIGVAISISFLTSLAFLLLVFPSAIVFCMLYVAAPVCIAERAGVGDSLSRSRFLTRGHRWQIFGAVILMAIVEVVVGGVITGVLSLSGAVAAASFAAQVVSLVLQTFFVAFNAVVAAVFYYQLRVAKEGIDLTKIASVFE
jgi:hypothetical protein